MNCKKYLIIVLLSFILSGCGYNQTILFNAEAVSTKNLNEEQLSKNYTKVIRGSITETTRFVVFIPITLGTVSILGDAERLAKKYDADLVTNITVETTDGLFTYFYNYSSTTISGDIWKKKDK